MDWKMLVVINYMADNLHRKNNLRELAQIVNMSPSHLSYKFKVETGISLARYQKALKLQKAKELLETTCLRIKEVMVMVGINDESHFVRDFKREFHVTPTEHRVLCMNIKYDEGAVPMKLANK